MITVVIVTYNTTTLIKQCMCSIRKFYPNLSVIIIDGSPVGSSCYKYTKGLSGKNTFVKNMGYNIGHGEGLKEGIKLAQTNYVALVDSDTILKGKAFEPMISRMRSNTYGVGKIVLVDKNGMNVENGIKYLHPYFAVINKNIYYKVDPIIHHGAPMINAMISLDKQSEYVIESFESIDNYVLHLERGTREQQPKEFASKTWSKVLQ